jgi:hypothetical protein
MWDSHFRVGGAASTNLGFDNCPKSVGFLNDCMAASVLLHVTSKASGYFENTWAWVADQYVNLNHFSSSIHWNSCTNNPCSDLDVPVNGSDTSSATQVSVYAGRGMLIESQGPSWFYGTGSEHAALYQYQLSNSKNVGGLCSSH